MAQTRSVSSSSRPPRRTTSSPSRPKPANSSTPSAASQRTGSTSNTSQARSTSNVHEARTRSVTDQRSTGTATPSRERDSVNISDDARRDETSSGSPVNFAAWGLDGARNGNASSRPGEGSSLSDNRAADARLAEQLAGKPMELGQGELLSRGSEGEKVTQLQGMLNKYAGAKLEPDGEMGRQTSRAVRQFQRENKLRMDGIVGPRTQEALNKRQAEANRKAEAEALKARDTAGVNGKAGTQSGEAVKKADEPRKADEPKKLDEAKKVDEPKKVDEAKKVDEPKKVDEAKKADEAKRVDEAKKVDEAKSPLTAEAPKKIEAPANTGTTRTDEVKQVDGAPKTDGALPPARPDGGKSVNLGRLSTLQSAQKNPDGSYSFRAGATIDVDGSGPHYGDPKASSQTSLRLKNEKGKMEYLNADKTPYFVLPPKVGAQMGAKPGDLGLISYNGKTIPAIFGDRGPKHRIGELSCKAAQDLGIPASPTTGGVPSGVDYRVFPGSGDKITKKADVTPERLNERVQQLLKHENEAKAGQVGASGAGQQAPAVNQVAPTGKVDDTKAVDAAQGAQKAELPVPVPHGLRGIMSTFGPAGSKNLESVRAAAGPGGKEIPVSMHKKIAGQFQKAFDEIKKQGLSGEIESFDGSFNNRSKRGGHSKSTHAWGIAFDLNADRYPQGTTPAQTSKKFQQIAGILEAHGFQQLARDAHHFQYATGY